MDEVTFDFSFLKKYKSHNRKKATLFLALSRDNIILKPFIVYCSNIEQKKETHPAIVTTQTETGDPDTDCLKRWVNDCVLPYTRGSPALLILDIWENHRDEDFRRLLEQNRIRVIELPAGVSCILNSLKHIIKFLIDSVTGYAKQSDCCSRKHKRVKQNMVNQWIMESLKQVLGSKANLLYSAFDCFK